MAIGQAIAGSKLPLRGIFLKVIAHACYERFWGLVENLDEDWR